MIYLRYVASEASMQINKVMMVDDDASIRKIAEVCLSRIGKWEVSMAESGPAMLAKIGDFKPDVLLLDVMMPGMDGPTTYARLKEAGLAKNVPVIFMTAKVQTQEVSNYITLGASGVISKPFNPMLLPAQISAILNTDSQRNEYEIARAV